MLSVFRNFTQFWLIGDDTDHVHDYADHIELLLLLKGQIPLTQEEYHQVISCMGLSSVIQSVPLMGLGGTFLSAGMQPGPIFCYNGVGFGTGMQYGKFYTVTGVPNFYNNTIMGAGIPRYGMGGYDVAPVASSVSALAASSTTPFASNACSTPAGCNIVLMLAVNFPTMPQSTLHLRLPQGTTSEGTASEDLHCFCDYQSGQVTHHVH